MSKPHPLNVDGDFYVEDGCCTMCGVPMNEAPELFGVHADLRGYKDCYVRRQPNNPDEIEQMLRAMWGAELSCIRYRGNDPEVFQRLAEANVHELCDHLPKESPLIQIFIRNQVYFDATDPTLRMWNGLELANAFRMHLERNHPAVQWVFKKIRAQGTSAILQYSWFENRFHELQFHRIESTEGLWLIENPGKLPGVSLSVHRWLVHNNRFEQIRWTCREARNTELQWRTTPF